MKRELIVQVPLSRAFLCAECGTIGNDAMRCPSCANECGLLTLANVLNRNVAPAVSQEAHA